MKLDYRTHYANDYGLRLSFIINHDVVINSHESSTASDEDVLGSVSVYGRRGEIDRRKESRKSFQMNHKKK